VIPFGLIAGFSGIDAGLSFAQTWGLSLIVFAGAAQLAAIDLWRQDAAPLVVLTTVLVINARMMMYSASLAPWFRDLSRRRKAVSAYVLTDQNYAVSIIQFDGNPAMTPSERFAFYFGAGISLWLVWQATTVIGAIVGTGLPEALALGFAITLVFLALLIPSITSRPTLVAAVVAFVVAVLAAPLPYNAGLLVAAAAGILAGLLAWGRDDG
jgi:4-azaleucine resistance transporter AzlC